MLNAWRQNHFVVSFAVGVIVFAGVNPFVQAGSNSGMVNFSATFVGGSCEIGTSKPQVIFNGGEGIQPATIASSPPKESFNLTLSKCSGWGNTPKITVSGESTVLYGPALFRDPGPESASEGYGILLSTEGNNSFQPNINLAQNKLITTRNWAKATQLNTIDPTLPIVAQLTCGNCNYSGRQGGDLIATVTFNFVYE